MSFLLPPGLTISWTQVHALFPTTSRLGSDISFMQQREPSPQAAYSLSGLRFCVEGGIVQGMGKKTVRFRCAQCTYCCTEVVCLPTPHDVIQIVRATGIHPEEFLEFIPPNGVSGIDKSDPTWLKCNGSRHIMALRRDHNRCYFLDDNRPLCRAYHARPLLCRLFPFKLRENRQGQFNGFTLHHDVACPRHRDGEVLTGVLHGLYLQDCKHQEAYRDLVRVFNRRRYVGKKPQDFIALFVEVQGPDVRTAAG